MDRFLKEFNTEAKNIGYVFSMYHYVDYCDEKGIVANFEIYPYLNGKEVYVYDKYHGYVEDDNGEIYKIIPEYCVKVYK